jgi:CubicO group peptidase (beta-lactamase class C family)
MGSDSLAREEAEAKVTEERHRFRTVELGSLRGLLPLVLVLAACVDSPTEATPFVETDVPPAVLPLDLREPWVLASPTSQAMDADALARAALEAADISRVRSLLVVRNGRLVLEQYFRGNHADSLNDVRSVTKSVMSTLTGIALEQGHLSGLDQTLGDFLGPELEGLEPGKAEISIGDVLTMTTGLEWPENNGSQSAYNDWIRSGDWVSHVLGQPLVDPPGSRFNYNSGAIHLLGIVLERATGQRLPDFADAHLFGPMGVDRVAWEAFSDGTFNGGAGIDIRPRDLARFGQLFLQDGHDGLHQRVPLAWVRTASRPERGASGRVLRLGLRWTARVRGAFSSARRRHDHRVAWPERGGRSGRADPVTPGAGSGRNRAGGLLRRPGIPLGSGPPEASSRFLAVTPAPDHVLRTRPGLRARAGRSAHSGRRAVFGSTRVARMAGTSVAANPVMASVPMIAVATEVSHASTP